MGSVEAEVLTVLEGVVGLLDLDELYRGLISAMRTAIASEWASLNDIGPRPEDVAVIVDPPLGSEQVAIFGRLREQNPLLARYARTRDGRPYRFSDVISREDYHRLDIYREFYGPLGVEHQIAFTLPAGPDRVLALVLSRRDPDYSDRERDVIERARPALIQIFRNAIAHRVATRGDSLSPELLVPRLVRRGLTPRQSQILAEVVSGRPRAEIADALSISDRTLSKHLQLAYRALGVSGRDEAAQACARLLRGATPGR